MAIKNDWNTHVKPKWVIELIDEDWVKIKWVWKKNIFNDNWAIIWEEIVDYIPINDNWWNVLPSSQRNFIEKWKWFPYQDLDERWKIIIKDMSPWDYYAQKNIWKDLVLMPWQRICYRNSNKNINAFIDIVYEDHNWEEIKFQSAKEFSINYTEKYVWINYYIVFSFFILLLLFILIFLLRRKKCSNKKCRKLIKKKVSICYYCWKKTMTHCNQQNENTLPIIRRH